MTFNEAIRSGLRFRLPDYNIFYERSEIALRGNGLETRMISFDELDSDAWEVEEQIQSISAAQLTESIKKALSSSKAVNLDQITIDSITEQVKSDLNLVAKK